MVEHSRSRRITERYVLLEEIAAGGMATVYFGQLRGPGGFSKDVAIKQMHAHVAREPGLASMLLDEARLAARVHHANVVGTLDVLEVGRELYIVMEFVHGEPLSRLLRVAREGGAVVDPAIVAGIMVGALRGLHAAHEATDEDEAPLGIVHRDVSPQNIVVGADGVPRILDFGVAKAIGRLQTTNDGQVKGKIAYMAPEQIRGEDIDRRVDVFAAGVVLWEALTNERLFAGSSEAASMAKILHDGVKPPSAVRPSVPAALDAVVMRALAFRREDRFVSASEFADALELALPCASTRRMADWIHETVGAALVTRKRRLADARSSAAVEEASAALQPRASEEARDVTTVDSFATPTKELGRARSRVPLWQVAAALVASAGLVVAVVGRVRPPASSARPDIGPGSSAYLPASLAPPSAPEPRRPDAAATAPSASAPEHLTSPPPYVAPPAISQEVPSRKRPRIVPAPPTSATAAPPAPSAPICHFDKVLSDGGIIMPVRVCQ